MSEKIRVAVIRGGPSHEYNVSLRTGAHVLSLLRQMPDKYEPRDIFISKSGEWHTEGLSRHPEQTLEGTDVVWNALHGLYEESGMAQELLEKLGMPFTGSYSVGSIFAGDKIRAKHVFRENSLLTPRHEVLESADNNARIIYIFQNFMHPVIVKPAVGGSSIGTRLTHSFEELKDAVKYALEQSKKVIVEEFIKGKEASCGVVEKARGQELYALLPIEVRRTEGKPFFDYESKYSGNTETLCPGTFSGQENKIIEDLARRAHQAFGLRHYSRSDFIITPKGKIYILETNNAPAFHEDALMPKALRSVGWHPRDFVDHCVNLALGTH